MSADPKNHPVILYLAAIVVGFAAGLYAYKEIADLKAQDYTNLQRRIEELEKKPGQVSADNVQGLEKRIAALEQELSAAKAQAARANDRITKLSLIESQGFSKDFGCGQESQMPPDSLYVMTGSRDGTGCGINNVNYYHKLGLKIPD